MRVFFAGAACRLARAAPICVWLVFFAYYVSFTTVGKEQYWAIVTPHQPRGRFHHVGNSTLYLPSDISVIFFFYFRINKLFTLILSFPENSTADIFPFLFPSVLWLETEGSYTPFEILTHLLYPPFTLG